MLRKLQDKWKVNGWNLLLIIATFSIGGSLCGYAGRKILLLTNIQQGALWLILYIIIVTLLWPFCVLLISIPLMQFTFFKKYIARVWNKMRGKGKTIATESIVRVAIFASGAGSNAKKIIDHFKNNPGIKIELVVSNKPQAGVIQVARDNGVAFLVIDKNHLDDRAFILDLEKRKIDFIILAGFLLKLPPALIRAFPKKIVNIHPALLPAYGGKGMYGLSVHEAVISNKEKQSGITIHYVDELYDHGEIIFQTTCDVESYDTPETLAGKIHQLEHIHFPEIIDNLLQKQNQR